MKSKTTTTAPTMYRQGDVLITRIAALPASITPRARDAGRIILAYGEVTGHAHAIADVETDPDAAIFDDPNSTDGAFFLRIERATGVVHEEHGRIDLAPGDYRITRQREYTPEAIRNVAD